jgi:hypothetical protein
MTSYNSNTANATFEAYTMPYASHLVDAAQAGTWTVQPGNTQNTIPWLVTTQPTTTGGTSEFHLVPTASSTYAQVIKNGAGTLYGYEIANASGVARFVKFYDKASAPTVGTDTPVRTIGILSNNRAGLALVPGQKFANGIAIGLTTAIADSSSAGVSAYDLSVDVDSM